MIANEAVIVLEAVVNVLDTSSKFVSNRGQAYKQYLAYTKEKMQMNVREIKSTNKQFMSDVTLQESIDVVSSYHSALKVAIQNTTEVDLVITIECATVGMLRARLNRMWDAHDYTG